jgi:hypothetical protein
MFAVIILTILKLCTHCIPYFEKLIQYFHYHLKKVRRIIYVFFSVSDNYTLPSLRKDKTKNRRESKIKEIGEKEKEKGQKE